MRRRRRLPAAAAPVTVSLAQAGGPEVVTVAGHTLAVTGTRGSCPRGAWCRARRGVRRQGGACCSRAGRPRGAWWRTPRGPFTADHRDPCSARLRLQVSRSASVTPPAAPIFAAARTSFEHARHALSTSSLAMLRIASTHHHQEGQTALKEAQEKKRAWADVECEGTPGGMAQLHPKTSGV